MLDICLLDGHVPQSDIRSPTPYSCNKFLVNVDRVYNSVGIPPRKPQRIVSSAAPRIEDMNPRRRESRHNASKRAPPDDFTNMETPPRQKETRSWYRDPHR